MVVKESKVVIHWKKSKDWTGWISEDISHDEAIEMLKDRKHTLDIVHCQVSAFRSGSIKLKDDLFLFYSPVANNR